MPDRITPSMRRDDPLRYNPLCKNPATIRSETMASRLASSNREATVKAIEAFRSGLTENNIEAKYNDLYQIVTGQKLLDRFLDFFRTVPRAQVLEHAARLIALSEIAKVQPQVPVTVLVKYKLLHPSDRDLESGTGNSLNWLIAHTSDRDEFPGLLSFGDGECSFDSGHYQGMVAFKDTCKLGALAGVAFPCRDLRVDARLVHASVEARTDPIGIFIDTKAKLASIRISAGSDPFGAFHYLRSLLLQADGFDGPRSTELRQSVIRQSLVTLEKLHDLKATKQWEDWHSKWDDSHSILIANMPDWMKRASAQARADGFWQVLRTESRMEGNEHGSGFPLQFLSKHAEYAIQYLSALIEAGQGQLALSYHNDLSEKLGGVTTSSSRLRCLQAQLDEAIKPIKPTHDGSSGFCGPEISRLSGFVAGNSREYFENQTKVTIP